MKKSFFDLTVSLEEDTSAIVDEAVAAGGDEPVEAADVVEAEEETAALVESQQDAEQQVATLEDAEVVADDLEDQLEEQEKIIEEKPEEVTEDTVAIAQEAMVISLTKLGMPYEEIRSYRVSLEANDSTPLQKFQVCTESLKDALVKVKDGIVNAVKAIINQIKKLWQNASIFFDRSAKTADKLIAELKNVTGNVNADDALIAKVNGKFGGWFLIAGNYDFEKILGFANGIKVPTFVPNQSSTKMIENLKAAVKYENLKISEEAKKNIDGTLPEGAVPSYVIGSKLTVITNDDIVSFTLKVDDIDKNKTRTALNGINVAKIISTLKNAKAAAGKMKDYQNSTFKAMDSIVAGLNKVGTKAEGDDAAEAKKELQIARKVGTKFALECVNQYIAAVNGTVACCAGMVKTITKKEESK